MFNTCIVWHGHHCANLPIELLGGSFEDRLRTIEIVKSLEENPQKVAWRKQLFKLVIGPLPEAVQQACVTNWQAYAAWLQARTVRGQAYDAWRLEGQTYDALELARRVGARTHYIWHQSSLTLQQVMIDYLPEIMALHTIECGCPWTIENRNIFNYMPKDFIEEKNQ